MCIRDSLTTAESVLKGTMGILPAICNTLYVIVVALIIVLPLGVCAAVYLTEYAKNPRLVEIIEFATETLAGIPSIIYALVGNIIFCVSLGLGKTLLAGSLTMVIMVLPTVMRTTQESLKTVPQSYRAVSYTHLGKKGLHKSSLQKRLGLNDRESAKQKLPGLVQV